MIFQGPFLWYPESGNKKLFIGGNIMIQELDFKDIDKVEKLCELLDSDLGRNYFIRIGLLDLNYFQNIWMVYEKEAMVGGIFLRKSGNLQVYIKESVKISKELAGFIQKQNFFKMIIPKGRFEILMDIIKFGYFVKGSVIAKYNKKKGKLKGKAIDDLEIRRMNISDINEVMELYKRSFKGFSSEERIRERLDSGEGRGYLVIKDGKIIAVAQTEFEGNGQCVIVGVATDRDQRKKGVGRLVVSRLVEELSSENIDIYIQYEEDAVGSFYEKLGFEKIDQLFDVYK